MNDEEVQPQPCGKELKSFLFVLYGENEIFPLSQDCYIALIQGEKKLTQFTGKNLLLLDLYVQVIEGDAKEILNQTCTWIKFDRAGNIDTSSASNLSNETAVASTDQLEKAKHSIFHSSSK